MYPNFQEFPGWKISGKKPAVQKSSTNTHRNSLQVGMSNMPFQSKYIIPGLWKLVRCGPTSICETEFTQNKNFLRVIFGLVGNFAQFSRFLIIHTQVITLLLEIKILMYSTSRRVYKQHKSFPEYQRRWAQAHLSWLLPSCACLQSSRSWAHTDRELSPDS